MCNRGHKQKMPREAVAAIVFVILSAMLIGSAIVLEVNKPTPDFGGLWQSIILSVLCSVAASVIFVLLQEAFSRSEHKELAEQLNTIEMALQHQSELYDSGIISIRPKSYFDGEDDFWKDIIKNTEKRLDLIGHSLSKWFLPEYEELFRNKIKSMVESEKEVRIVLSASDINLNHVRLAFLEKLDTRQLAKSEKTILKFVRLLQTVDEKKRKNLKIYVVDPSKVTYMYIRTDYQSIISPYIFSPSNNQNTFLLELQSATKYAKTFEDDFREMIEELNCLDLSLKKPCLKVIDCVKNKNQYSGNGWNHENTTKYLYSDGFMEYEVGYFEHYADNEFVKAVIELPVSYGCPSKCKFCASSAIQEFQPLSMEQMMALFEELYTTHRVYDKEKILVSLTGMGDIFFNPDNVMAFLQALASYKNLQVTLSSCLWNKALLEKVIRMETRPPFRNIQVTFVSDKLDVLNRVMPVYAGETPNLSEVFGFIENSDEQNFRINYVLMKDLNDSEEDFLHIRDMLTEVKDKVVVRISMLNETKSTKRNNLFPSELKKAEQLKELLSDSGINSYLFYSAKNDSMNCGQLVTEREN